MNVIRATALGMCFGVRDALQITQQIDHPKDVTIHGELVHNPQVLVQLQSRGFQMVGETERDQIPQTPRVLITAHGISQRERQRLTAAGKQLIDTTCPLVRRVHDAAQRLERDGLHVLLIGRPGHVEIRGIAEDLEQYDVLASVEDVRCWSHARLGVVCQSTTPPRLAAKILREIAARNPQAEVQYVNTICQPTLERQQALETLCQSVDAVVVVGGANSNNTRQLLNLAREGGSPAWQVETAADLRAEWFVDCDCVGLTAGTSALDETIDAVEQSLRSLPPVSSSPTQAEAFDGTPLPA